MSCFFYVKKSIENLFFKIDENEKSNSNRVALTVKDKSSTILFLW